MDLKARPITQLQYQVLLEGSPWSKQFVFFLPVWGGQTLDGWT